MSRLLQTLGLSLLAAAALGLAACGGGSNASSNASPCNSQAVLASASAPSTNVAPLTVDGGPVIPNPSGGTMLAGTFNQAYTSVTICAPGTSNCQTIDHVWVDTGSYGLRLMCTPFIANNLPPSKQGGNTVANCQQFVASHTWGAVRTADVQIGGESAGSMPIQVIADASVPATAPTSCSSAGAAQNTVAKLGANGLLGIGPFRQDCGLACETNTSPPDFYYTCPSGSCSPVNMATTLQVQNVVGHFATDNNGTLIQMPTLAAGGAASSIGKLIFGINTQSNNTIGTETVFAADPTTGYIQTSTTYGDMTEPASYIDSGSNAYYFNDSTITPQCTGVSAGLYCPASPVSRAATMLPYNTPSNPATFTYSFSVMDITTSPNLAFNDAGGTSGTCSSLGCTFAWGMPFFYGRNVFTALEGTTIASVSGPFFAATTP